MENNGTLDCSCLKLMGRCPYCNALVECGWQGALSVNTTTVNGVSSHGSVAGHITVMLDKHVCGTMLRELGVKP